MKIADPVRICVDARRVAHLGIADGRQCELVVHDADYRVIGREIIHDRSPSAV